MCGFFERLLDSSLVMKLLKSDLFSGKHWHGSIVYKIIKSPVNLLTKFANKHGDRLGAIGQESLICGFFANLARVPLREYGYILGAMAAGAIPTSIVMDKPYFWIAPILAALLILIPASPVNIVSSSLATKLVKNSFFDGGSMTDAEAYHLKKPVTACIIAAVFGAVLGLSSPLLVLLVFVGVIAVGAVMARFEVGVYLTVAALPFAPTMALVALIALTFVSFLFRLGTDRHFEYRTSQFSLPLVMFLVMTFVSTLFSANFTASLKIALVYTVFSLFFVLFVNTVRTKKQWKNVIYLLVMCAAAVALYGIFQNFFLDSTTSSWVDSENFEEISTRVYSTFANPNVLGQYFILLFPVAFALMWTKMGEWQRFVNLAVNLAVFLCLIFTWSRGAWLGVLIAVAFFIMRKDKFWLTMCFLVVLVVPSVLPASILGRLTSIGDTSDSSTSYRIAIWTASARMIKDKLITGIGIGPDAYLAVYPKYALSGAEYALHSHSFYFQWLVEMGVGGIITFVSLIICTFKQIVNAGRSSKFIRTVLLAMGCAMLGWLFQGIVENLWYNYRMMLFFWMYIAVIATGYAISREGETEVSRD